MNFANVYMYSTCNYDCPYCSGNQGLHENMGKIATREGMDKIVNFFNKRGQWHIDLNGGEPSIHPHFLSFCESLTQNHKLSIITNLSKDVDAFCMTIKPDQVILMFCSLQPRGELEFKKLYNRVMLLKSKGFKVQVTYVASPERLPKVEKYFNLFKAENIEFIVSPLVGSYQSKVYPSDYSEIEKEIIKKNQLNVGLLHQLEFPEGRKSTGKRCAAGHSQILIDARTGDIYPCHQLRKVVIGNIYEDRLNLFPEEILCRAKTCQCWLDSKSQETFLEVANGAVSNIEPVKPEDYEKFKKAVEPEQWYDEYWERKERELIFELFPQQDKKILIYGGGIHTAKLLKVVEKYGSGRNIIGIVDKDPAKKGISIKDILVHSADEITELHPDIVVISSKTYEDEI